MAVSSNGIKKLFSLPHIFNTSYDDTYQVLTFEPVELDTVSGSTVRVPATRYAVNDVENASATVTYVGSESVSGTYLIRKIDKTSGTQVRYATQLNNASVTTYTQAWTNRATLTYDLYSTAL